MEALSDITLKILVNNIGGNANAGPLMETLQGSSLAVVNTWIDVSARFPAIMTKLALPYLTKEKSAILNIGSGVGLVPCPWLVVYGGCKSFNNDFSQCLDIELAVDGHDVESICILVGEVATER
jgi:17beta-estradiol 17-dehydrogenase / very-long-chain 3-oxoacyl-CoA reductase